MELTYQEANQLLMQERDYDTDLAFIINFVRTYRLKYNIIPKSEPNDEFSCIGFGEGHNLLFQQLIYTREGEGSWVELEISNIAELVLEEIKKYVEK